MNEEIIKQQIEQKKSSMPYFCPPGVFTAVKSDLDEFPYRRFFRGQADKLYPTVWDRGAGYAKVISSPAFNERPKASSGLTNLCFQIPCSTVLPCKKNNDTKLHNTYNAVYYSP